MTLQPIPHPPGGLSIKSTSLQFTHMDVMWGNIKHLAQSLLLHTRNHIQSLQPKTPLKLQSTYSCAGQTKGPSSSPSTSSPMAEKSPAPQSCFPRAHLQPPAHPGPLCRTSGASSSINFSFSTNISQHCSKHYLCNNHFPVQVTPLTSISAVPSPHRFQSEGFTCFLPNASHN